MTISRKVFLFFKKSRLRETVFSWAIFIVLQIFLFYRSVIQAHDPPPSAPAPSGGVITRAAKLCSSWHPLTLVSWICFCGSPNYSKEGLIILFYANNKRVGGI